MRKLLVFSFLATTVGVSCSTVPSSKLNKPTFFVAKTQEFSAYARVFTGTLKASETAGAIGPYDDRTKKLRQLLDSIPSPQSSENDLLFLRDNAKKIVEYFETMRPIVSSHDYLERLLLIATSEQEKVEIRKGIAKSKASIKEVAAIIESAIDSLDKELASK